MLMLKFANTSCWMDQMDLIFMFHDKFVYKQLQPKTCTARDFRVDAWKASHILLLPAAYVLQLFITNFCSRILSCSLSSRQVNVL